MREEQAEAERLRKERASEVHPTPITQPTDTPPKSADWPLGSTFQDDLFMHRPARARLKRREKRLARHQHGLVRAKDSGKSHKVALTLPVSHDELKAMQEQDETLKTACELSQQTTTTQHPFLQREGLLYRRWMPKNTGQNSTKELVDQLVLPQQCRQRVMTLAHSIPLAGHLGRKKTYRRIAQHFYQ